MIRLLLTALVIFVPLRAQDLPDGPGKDLFSKVCSACHGLDLATGQKKTAEDWKATVDKMVTYGADASEKDFETIVAYLAKNFGPGDADKKPADDKDKKPADDKGKQPADKNQASVRSDAKVQDDKVQSVASANVMPEGQGKEIILRECTACHLPDHFTKYRHTNEEWQAVVIRMGQRVRSASKEELDIVQKYLATNYPKVEEAGKLNVNKATAKEIETGLALTPSEANAVVEYRRLHGNFMLWGELLAIYGVDGFKIEAAKDRMSF